MSTYIPVHETNKNPKTHRATVKIIKITLNVNNIAKLKTKDDITESIVYYTLNLFEFGLTFESLCNNIEKSKYWIIKYDDKCRVLKMTQGRLFCAIF
jgi:hypothetical protein